MAAPTPLEKLAYRWNPAAQRYIHVAGPHRGQFVSRAAVRDELDKAVAAAQQRQRDLALAYSRRQISIAEFQTGMRGVIRDVHVYGAAAAKGGWAQMTQADWGLVGSRVRVQLEYLNGFAQQLEKDLVPMDGRFLARAEQYSNGGVLTYEEIARREHVAQGYDEARRVAESKPCPGCAEQARLGWRPIQDVPLIGSEQCRGNCRCHIEYRKSSAASS